MIPRGWKIERKADVLKTIHITAPNGYVASVSTIDRNPENVLYMLADALLKGTDAEIYAGIAAGYTPRFQGGFSNDDLRDALQSKLPGFQHTDRDPTMFALGVEVGTAGVQGTQGGQANG